jgi:choline monooxygenase
MPQFEIEANIRAARTLPSEFYTDAQNFELSKEKIFSRTWQFIGTADEVESLKPVTLLPGFLNEPLLLAKNGDSISCLSNVCTHRGKILIEEPCKANLIRCGYHGRRFSLDGKFLSMPEFDGVIDFPSESDNLKQIAFANRVGFLFASVDPIAPFKDYANEVAVRFEDLDPDELKLTSVREYEIDAHWALYCENYLEGFHIPFVHKSLNEIVDYGTYTTELFRYSSMQTGYDADGNIAGRYLFVFPSSQK